ncbi:uncharacterized protein LOC143457990 [Clavelina lepadiformis]|uniref:uncharacterized protein LOC143457990 n=1 Tax=Clavelina lepadiformis TaxID=159417 RepID=UPI004042F262
MWKCLAGLLFLCVIIDAKDRCPNVGGDCLHWPTHYCRGGWEVKRDFEERRRFLCMGGLQRRCCFPCGDQCMAKEKLWSREDIACNNARGRCQNTTNFCNGVYATGMCGGPFDRQCCDPKISPGGSCPLITFQPTDHVVPFGDLEIRIHPDFIPAMDVISKASKDCGVVSLVGFTFRKRRRKPSSRTRRSGMALYNNHMVGHAVDVFLNTTEGVCDEICIFEGEKPGARCFTDTIASGGLFMDRFEFPLHIDDRFNNDVPAWRKLLKELRRLC